MFRAAKDLVASKAAHAYLKKVAAPYADLESLSIDSQKKEIQAVCVPHGETGAVKVSATYKIIEKGSTRRICVTGSSCSKVWLGRLITDFLHDREFELPTWAAGAL